MKKFILIGGAPTTGKSTLAQNLSQELSLPWLSTDQIRMLLKVYANRENTGGLFLPEGYDTAETFLSYFSVEEIVDMEFAQAYDVWPGIQTILNDCYTYINGCIIEGVNITPEIIHKYLKNRKDVLPIIIIDEDEDRIRKTIFTRGLFDDANKYNNDYKEKEVEWVKLFITKLKEDCKKYDIPYISVSKTGTDTEKLISAIDSYFTS